MASNVRMPESLRSVSIFSSASDAILLRGPTGSGKNGYLILGAKDDGSLSGLKVDDALMLKMTNIRTDARFGSLTFL